MIPLSQSAFWGPMAVTIMGGLFVATFLTLFFVPALYALVFGTAPRARKVADGRELAHGLPAAVPAE